MPLTNNGGNIFFAGANTDASISAISAAMATSIGDRLDARHKLDSILYFKSSSNFEKAKYDGIKAIRVKCLGGGGGSAGAAVTAVSQYSVGYPGAGGHYSEIYLEGDAIPDVATITIGAGGTAGAAGNNAGGNGGTTFFGIVCSAPGGRGGAGGGIGTAQPTSGASAINNITGTAKGDFTCAGEAGGNAKIYTYALAQGYTGGGNYLYGNTNIKPVTTTGLVGVTPPAGSYGVGASGAVNCQSQAARAGAAGAPGICIVEVYK